MEDGSICATLVDKHSWNVRNEHWNSGITYKDLGGNWTDTCNEYLPRDWRDSHEIVRDPLSNCVYAP
jgi:hypothetical protein